MTLMTAHQQLAVTTLQDQKYNEEFYGDTFRIYLIFQMYYNGMLLDGDSLEEAISMIGDYINKHLPDYKQQGADTLIALLDKGLGFQDLEEYKNEFHRLFVGPDRLMAPPYESYYRNPQKLLMQKETLMVRKFYQRAGVEVSRQGSMPDDHLGLELELICFLLSQGLANEDLDKREHYYLLYRDFLQQHLTQWINAHCSLVAQESSNPICSGMNSFFDRFIRLQQEKETIC